MRLEDMNALFGDATSQMPTPASRAENASLFGQQSPVPSLTLGQHGADSAIPGLDIDPPNIDIENGKPVMSRSVSSNPKEGVGGWISGMVRRGKGNDDGDERSGSYKPVGQNDES